MKHIYKISGMSCIGFKTNVESALSSLDEMIKVTTNLKIETLEVEMTSHISLERLQEILLKAGLLYPVFGLLLSPMLAAAAMSFSSVSVIVNSLRLRHIKL